MPSFSLSFLTVFLSVDLSLSLSLFLSLVSSFYQTHQLTLISFALHSYGGQKLELNSTGLSRPH